MVNIAIAGIGGRMGRAMAAIIAAGRSDYNLAAGFEFAEHPALGQELSAFLGLPGLTGRLEVISPELLAGADVLLDFTRPEGSMQHLDICAQAGKAVVLGTTGFSAEQKTIISDYAGRIPLVFASNYSVAMNLMFQLVGEMAAILGSDYALEVIEAHHDQKVDAPSGTAWTLLEALAKARNLNLDKACRHGRHGINGPRAVDEIGVSVIRGGDIVGEHTVMFIGQGERLDLTHRVQTRDTFAQGAIRAAAWLVGKGVGLYDMKDVLGLKD